MSTEVKRGPINIYLESNPNPNSLKFVVNYMLLPEGVSFDFPDEESAANAPLAQKLFQNFDFVTRVFYMSNFITVAKTDDKEWIEIQNELKYFIQDYLKEGKPLLLEDLMREKETEDVDSSEMDQRIKGILDEYVRPAVEQDGGAISFHSYENGIVKLLLQGSCSGCPSSMITLKAGIENLLKRLLPEVKGVEAEEL